MATAELLSIGTELLLGQILNTNTQFLSGQLADIGIDCLYHTTVGDNPLRIKECLARALSRCDIVISTGGLGPTDDDLTHQCMAELFQVEMVFDQSVLDFISEFFARRRLVMAPSNRRQATRPEGSDILPNLKGTAPGIIWKVEPSLLAKAGIEGADRPRYILTFPGVPSEMQAMWNDTGGPYLAGLAGPSVVWSCELKHFGIPESCLAERYTHLLSGLNPTVAPLAGAGECRLRVTAKAKNHKEARELAQPVLDEIRAQSGYLCYGSDSDTLESVVANMLRAQGETVSVAESCTGGWLSKRLTDIPGSSDYVRLNVVTYSNEAKERLLGVPARILEESGAVSRECAEAMARGVRELAQADIGIGVTGIAGPGGGTPEKPVGTVYIALASPERAWVGKRLYHSGQSRGEIRQRSASDALNMLRLYLLDPALLEEEYARSCSR